MLRNRLIFVLFYSDGYFVQSRNFRLQKIGKLDWLKNNINFFEIAKSLDELIIVDLSTNKTMTSDFLACVKDIAENVYIPITVGGGIQSKECCIEAFHNGADKILINSMQYAHPNEVETLISTFGAQAIMGCVEYNIVETKPVITHSKGTHVTDLSFNNAVEHCIELGVGELLINCISKDGTGFGYDTDILKEITSELSSPIIIMGGAGHWKHLNDGLKLDAVNAVATGNLLNFIGNSLIDGRKYLLKDGRNLVDWHQVQWKTK